MREPNLLKHLIMYHTLCGVRTACPCIMGYPQPSPRGCCRSKPDIAFAMDLNYTDLKSGRNVSEKYIYIKFYHASHIVCLYLVGDSQPSPRVRCHSKAEGPFIGDTRADRVCITCYSYAPSAPFPTVYQKCYQVGQKVCRRKE